MRIAFFCNALDSSSALYNIFSHVCANLRRNEGEVLHRARAGWHLGLFKFDMLVYDSAFCLAHVRAQLGGTPHHYKHVALHHIYESPKQRATKEGWFTSCRPDLVITTFQEMADDVARLGIRSTVVPFSFDTTRFQHLPYPETFTVGYMGADKAHKGFDPVDRVCAKLNIPCIGARRESHENGPYAKRESDFYRQISCYAAIPSHESGPLPPIEAALCGRPVVVSHVGMMPYIFEHGAGGFLALDEECLEDGIKRVRDNFEEHAAKSRAFVLPDTSAQYEEAFESVL